MQYMLRSLSTLQIVIVINPQGEADYRSSRWKARTGELMLGFLDLSNGGVRCSMAYFTLLPVIQGKSVEAGQFYKYSGTFIAPLDSAVLSMVVGYEQHVWVDYVKLEMLHDGKPREYECTKSVSVVPETPCIFPFATSGHVIPFCSESAYYSEGFGWCAIAVKDDGISCPSCEEQSVTWEACTECTITDSTPEESVKTSCETGARTTIEGESCVFPFVYNGKTYTDCTTDPYDTWLDGVYPPTRPWCGLDAEGYLIGECAPCGDFEVSTSELEGNTKPPKHCLCIVGPKVLTFRLYTFVFLSGTSSFCFTLAKFSNSLAKK
jgi:hypothetical protein